MFTFSRAENLLKQAFSIFRNAKSKSFEMYKEHLKITFGHYKHKDSKILKIWKTKIIWPKL